MARTRKRFRLVPVKALGGSWETLKTVECQSYEGHYRIEDNFHVYLHKSKNNRWFFESYDFTRERTFGAEITLDAAVDWIYENIYSGSQQIIPFDQLPDAASKPSPPHGGHIVVACLECRAAERRMGKVEAGSRRGEILKVFRSAKAPLTAKQVAERSGLKPDSGLRGILSELVNSEIIVKLPRNEGYLLKSKARNRPMS